jgi:hypothetical protein
MGAWEDGFKAGWRERDDFISSRGGMRRQADVRAKVSKKKPKARKASAHSKKYGRAFKRLAPKYKKKSGGWKKDGFKRCAAAARKAAKK